jgi:predicted transcriptional regulator
MWDGLMVNCRRSEIEIICDILNLSRDGAKRTEILYKGNLSYTQLQKYLPFLVEKEILYEYVINNGNGSSCKMYKTTDKGLTLLQDINKIYEHLSW